MKKALAYLLGLLSLSVMFSCSPRAEIQADYRVIPLPQNIRPQEGESFILNSSTVIYCPEGDADLAATARQLSGYIAELTGLELRVTHKERNRNIICIETEDAAGDNPEAYILNIDGSTVKITGAGHSGAFYGVQTLRKSLPVLDGRCRIALPPVKIEDMPRFGYRGMHLDVARHMFPVAFIKKYIDLLALHNINTFHWHLTDDQGWRIEIRKHPKLAEISSQRKETLVGHWEKPDHKYDGKPYGGYYTQEEIEKMKAEAEANAEADKKEREKIDKLNQADSMIFSTENQLKELGDKLPADKKAPIEAALQKLKDAHKAQDLSAIDTAMAELNTAFQAASAEMYAQSGAQGGAQAGPGAGAGQQANQGSSSNNKEDIQDADFEEVK